MKDYAVVVKWSDYRWDTFFFDDLHSAINDRNAFRKCGGESYVYAKVESEDKKKDD